MTPTATRATSSGNHTLSEWLTWAIVDYRRVFGREPKLIVIPIWREDDTTWEYMDRARPWVRYFRGIPVKVTILREYIELRGRDE